MSDLQTRIQRANELAQKHAAMQQGKTCEWYNRDTKVKSFQPGDYCIILVPDDHRKLFVRWSEPCKVVKQVTDTSYAVNMDGRQIVKHVICLRPFTPRMLSAADWNACSFRLVSGRHIGPSRLYPSAAKRHSWQTKRHTFPGRIKYQNTTQHRKTSAERNRQTARGRGH